jgi:hypothetical protein
MVLSCYGSISEPVLHMQCVTGRQTCSQRAGPAGLKETISKAWQRMGGTQMADLMIPVADTLAVLWHIGVWGLAIILAVLWTWELSASRQQAKAERNLQDWSKKAQNLSLDRFEPSSTELALSAEMNSDVLSRISPRAAQRHGL